MLPMSHYEGIYVRALQRITCRKLKTAARLADMKRVKLVRSRARVLFSHWHFAISCLYYKLIL